MSQGDLPFKVYRRDHGGKWTKVDEAATSEDAVAMVIRFRGGHADGGDPPGYQVRGPQGIVPPVWLRAEREAQEAATAPEPVLEPPSQLDALVAQVAQERPDPVLDEEGQAQEAIALGGPFMHPYPPDLPEGYQGYRVLKMLGPSGNWKVVGEADTRDEVELYLPPALRNLKPEGYHPGTDGAIRVGTTWPKWALQGEPVTIGTEPSDGGHEHPEELGRIRAGLLRAIDREEASGLPDPALAAADPDWQAGPVGPHEGESLGDYNRRRGHDLTIQRMRMDASEAAAQARPETRIPDPVTVAPPPLDPDEEELLAAMGHGLSSHNIPALATAEDTAPAIQEALAAHNQAMVEVVGDLTSEPVTPKRKRKKAEEPEKLLEPEAAEYEPLLLTPGCSPAVTASTVNYQVVRRVDGAWRRMYLADTEERARGLIRDVYRSGEEWAIQWPTTGHHSVGVETTVDPALGEARTSYQVWRRPRPGARFELVGVGATREAAERYLPGAPASGETWAIQAPLDESGAYPLAEVHPLPENRLEALERGLEADMAAAGPPVAPAAVEVTREAVERQIRHPHRGNAPQVDRAAHDLPEAGFLGKIQEGMGEAIRVAEEHHPGIPTPPTTRERLRAQIAQADVAGRYVHPDMREAAGSTTTGKHGAEYWEGYGEGKAAGYWNAIHPSPTRYRVLYRPGDRDAWQLAGEFDTIKEAEAEIPEYPAYGGGAYSILLPATVSRGGLWTDEEPPLDASDLRMAFGMGAELGHLPEPRLDQAAPDGYLGSEDHFQRGREWGHMEAKKEIHGSIHGFHLEIKLDLHGNGVEGLEGLLAALAALKR
jgi:hypothetical protein